jgi:hypothetical protein
MSLTVGMYTELVLHAQLFYWETSKTVFPKTPIGTTLLQLTICNRKTSETLSSHAKSNYRIMFMRYLNLALLVSTALSQSAPESANSNEVSRQLGDFNWDIEPEDGYPMIAFDDANEESEVTFKYNFTGTLSDRKYLGVTLYQSDCISLPDASLAFVNSTTGDELDVELDIIQETISNSIHYTDVNGTAAIIGFCLRVDYNYVDGDNFVESINFYETNVTITVDLTANFTLTGISADRTSADAEAANADLDYPVEAYICLEDNSEVFSPAALEQGSILQVCVRIDETVSTENILVEDILTFVVSQPDGTATDSTVISSGVPDPLTDKICRESGICNVKTQLLSKFFTDINPGDLRVDGVAILAFGKASLMPSSAPSGPGRRLRAPIRGLLSADDVKALMASQQYKSNNGDESGVSVVSVAADKPRRKLQEAKSEFGVDVGLVGFNGPVVEDETGAGSGLAAGAVVVLVLLACGCGLGFFFCTRKDRKEDTKNTIHHHSSNGSVGTYPMSQGSVYSTSSNQHVSHRARDQQID